MFSLGIYSVWPLLFIFLLLLIPFEKLLNSGTDEALIKRLHDLRRFADLLWGGAFLNLYLDLSACLLSLVYLH